VQNFGIVLSDIKYISEEVHQSMKGTEVIANDLLLNITGGSLGRCAVVPINFKIGNVSQHVCILRTVLVKPEYLHCFILSSFFAKSMKITGSGREGLPKYNLEKMLFPLPPIHEQERIIIEVKQLLNYIDKLDTCRVNLIELVSHAKSKVLDLAIHGKLVPQNSSDEPASELLKRINPKAEITCDNSQYGKLPNGWCETLLGNIGTWQSGATPSRLRKDYYGGSIPWLKTGDLNDGIVQSIPECITERALEETSVKLNPAGSILIAMYGATIGRIGILSKPATTNQACCACVDYLPEKKFLFYFLLANRENFIAMGGGGAQPNISKEKIIHTHIPLPPQQEQHRIVAKIEELFAQLDNITSSL